MPGKKRRISRSKPSGNHCGRFSAPPISRRDLLSRTAMGFGSVALAGLLKDPAYGADADSPGGKHDIIDRSRQLNPFAVRKTHYAPRATNIIYLYMDGGPSQVDTFDYKPMLKKHDGKKPGDFLTVEPTQFDNIGNVMASPWAFKQYGQCGRYVSDLFPNVAKHVDDIAFVHSMTSKFPEHTNANYFLHTGLGIQGRPSMGSWITYGLGSVNRNMPGYIVINSGLIPPGGLDNFNSGFLPAAYQGSIFKSADPPVSNIRRNEASDELQRAKLDLVRQFDRGVSSRFGKVDAVESAISNFELAYRMQVAVPELMDFSNETDATKDSYGFDQKWKGTQTFARSCLLARRLVERGVRFVEVTCPGGSGDRWDQHGGLRDGHEKNARSVDQPIAALLADLKQRGLLDSTLVVWSGEFGRTPFAQGRNGRDHNPQGFTLWMAGGGVKGGISYGATDEFGYKAVENRLEIYDLHATMLHMLGMDHTKLTYRWSGRDMRLTDVHGHVVHDIVA